MTGSAESRIAVVVELFRPAESIYFDPYLSPFGDTRTALSWCLGRFRDAFPSDTEAVEIFVVSNEAVDGEALRRACAGTTILQRRGLNRLEAYLEVAASGAAILLCVTPETAFLDSGAWLELLELHRRGRPAFTALQGMPAGAMAIAYESSAVSQLRELRLPGLPEEPELMLRALAAASGADGTSEQSISYAPFAAVSNVPAADIPETLSLVTEYRRAGEAVGGGPYDPSRSLAAWKRLRISRQEECARALSEAPVRGSRAGTPRQVLFVTAPSGFSGAEQSLCHLASHLDPRRYRSTVLVAFEGQLTAELRRLGVPVICPNLDFNQLDSEAVRICVDACRDVDAAIVHINGLGHGLIAATAKMMGRAVIEHIRVAPLPPSTPELSFADGVITVSEYVRQCALVRDVAPERVAAVWNGIDRERFYPGVMDRAAARRTLGIPADARLALMIGRFVESKRHDTVVEAVALCREAGRDIHCLIVGEVFGNTGVFRRIEELVRERGVQDLVKFAPFQKDIRIAHCAADVFVLPSESEPLARSILEAMALGTLVVASDSGGNRELVRNGDTGLLFPLGDARGLADALTMALDRDLSAIRMRALQTIADSFSIERSVEATMAFYDRVLERIGAPVLAAPATAPA